MVELLDKTETNLMEISDKNFKSDFQTIESLLYEAKQEIEASQKAGGVTSGVPSGLGIWIVQPQVFTREH